MMSVEDSLDHYARALETQRRQVADAGQDAPRGVYEGRRVTTVGALHLYTFLCAGPPSVQEDVPVTLLLPGHDDPVEGLALETRDASLLIQTDESMGDAPDAATLVPDHGGLLQTAARRLTDMARRAEAYHLGTAERLLPLFAQVQAEERATRRVESPAFAVVWDSERASRRARLFTHIADMVRADKRILLLCPSHKAADDLLGALARQLKRLALPYASLLSRYETDMPKPDGTMPLRELGFEAQRHRSGARARADKALLRRRYERFKELTPILAYKMEKQKDLNEVKGLEGRLRSQISHLQSRLSDVKTSVDAYESIPVWKRLAMQAVGKNLGTLPVYATLYESRIRELMNELKVAQQRSAELTPEAAIPKDMKPEYQDLKEEIARVGGTKKIHELITDEEGDDRHSFLKSKRIVVATPARVAADPLFGAARFDALIADDAPLIPAPFLLAAAGLAGERILLSGDPRQIQDNPHWQLPPQPARATPLAATR